MSSRLSSHPSRASTVSSGLSGARRLQTTEPVLSRADCETLFHRIVGFRKGTADLTVSIRTTWSLNFRWARSRPTTSGDTTEYLVTIGCGAVGNMVNADVTRLDDASLKTAVQALEQQLASNGPSPSQINLLGPQQYLEPKLWSDATAQAGMQLLSDAARHGVEPTLHSTAVGKMVAAGYTEVGAASWAIFNTKGLAAYAAVTGANYSETMRNIDGTASGWAGQRNLEWARLDTATLAKMAMERCVASANPVAIEPGRYTAILTADMVGLMLDMVMQQLERADAEGGGTVFSGSQPGTTKLGQQVLDARLTMTSDPMDPDCGFIPFDPEGNPYPKTTWIENGVLKAMAYDRAYAQKHFGTDVALPNPQTFRCSGGPTATTSVDEMIATTGRGILVTHCGMMSIDDRETLSVTTVTRDGLWLVEHGKISHPIKNMWINESPMFVFNRVLQIGPTVVTKGVQQYSGGIFDDVSVLRDLPSRAVCDGLVLIAAPPMKVQDFNFIRLTDAV